MSWIAERPSSSPFNVMRVMSLQPRAMDAVQQVSNSVIHGASALTRAREEMVGTVVSVANRCRY